MMLERIDYFLKILGSHKLSAIRDSYEGVLNSATLLLNHGIKYNMAPKPSSGERMQQLIDDMKESAISILKEFIAVLGENVSETLYRKRTRHFTADSITIS